MLQYRQEVDPCYKYFLTKALSFSPFLSLTLYFLLSILIVQHKTSVITCFILAFNVIFYILRNEYLNLLLYCIHVVVIVTFHTDIVTHTSDTCSVGLKTYQLNIP